MSKSIENHEFSPLPARHMHAVYLNVSLCWDDASDASTQSRTDSLLSSSYTTAPRRGIKQWCCLTSVAYIGPKSRTERPRKTKIGTEIDHVTCDLDTTFKVKWLKANLQGAGAYCGGLHSTVCYLFVFVWWCRIVWIQSQFNTIFMQQKWRQASSQ